MEREILKATITDEQLLLDVAGRESEAEAALANLIVELAKKTLMPVRTFGELIMTVAENAAYGETAQADGEKVNEIYRDAINGGKYT